MDYFSFGLRPVLLFFYDRVQFDVHPDAGEQTRLRGSNARHHGVLTQPMAQGENCPGKHLLFHDLLPQLCHLLTG